MIEDRVHVRRVEPADAAALAAFYANLSADSRAERFHDASRGISRDRAAWFATADHRGRDGFVAVVDGRIVGHIVLEPEGPGVEELGVAVADELQHHGVGTLLMAAAVASARLRGVRRLVAWLRPENAAMRRLFTGTAHAAHLVHWDGLVGRYELDLPPRPLRSTAEAAQAA